ncbi:MAG TPA: LysM peptidoglycan-binding domain-containing protein [Aggregatilineales bacterium]|nr:LysM peptidoglycan-binding domain-containing protein [Aggregatilineales bacterium]
MRSRAITVLLLIGLFLLVILAQTGSLSNVFSALSLTTAIPTDINGRPVVTARPIIFSTAVPPGVTIYPTYYVPTTVYPVYAPTYPGQPAPVGQPTTVPSGGIVSPDGQCIVPNGWVQYTIQSGDTIAAIASSYGLSVQTLAAANCMQNPDLIYPGQVLAVPATQ